jgi:hypothetical protein
MLLLHKVLALQLPDQEQRFDGANMDFTASAGTPNTVGAASGAACVEQMRRSCAVHSAMGRRAIVLQTNRARSAAEMRTRQQLRHQGTVCLCGDRPREPAMSCLILVRIMANALVLMTARRGGEATRPPDGKIKGREARRGRAGEERRHIRHFARGAIGHDSLPACATPLNVKTMYTSRAPRHDPRR